MKIELTEDEVALLLNGMDTIIRMANRWPLEKVKPFIALMHKIDDQTLSRHGKDGGSQDRGLTHTTSRG